MRRDPWGWGLFWSAALATLLLRCTPPWQTNHDTGWFLYLADRVLRGDRLYVDLVEVNPPLVVYLHTAPVLLARACSWPAAAVFAGMVAVAIGCSLFACDRLLRRASVVAVGPTRPLVLIALLLALGWLPGPDFGQREHLLCIATLPWLLSHLLTSRQVPGQPLPVATALTIGLCAGLGLALKPHFLLAAVAVHLVARRRRGPELYGMLAALGGYALHFPVTPIGRAYLAALPEVLAAYPSFHPPFDGLLTRPWFLWSGLAGLLLGSAALFARRPAGRHLARVGAAGWAGAVVAAVLQAKGWSYHFLPSSCYALTGLAVFAALGAPVRLRRLRPGRALAIAGVFVVVLALARHCLDRDPATGALGLAHRVTTRPAILAAVPPLPAGAALVWLDLDIHPFFAWLQAESLVWASRYACLWPWPAARDDPSRAAALRQEVIDDLRRHRPVWLCVRRRAPDLLDFLAADPRWASFCAGYERVSAAGAEPLILRRR